MGSPHEAITKSVASDLERRGYIVFITAVSPDEENAVQNEGGEDIRPLWLDLANVGDWLLLLMYQVLPGIKLTSAD